MSDKPSFFVGQLVRVKDYPGRQGFIRRVGEVLVNIELTTGALVSYSLKNIEPVVDPGESVEEEDMGFYEKVGPTVRAYRFCPPEEQEDFKLAGDIHIRVTPVVGWEHVGQMTMLVYTYAVKSNEDGYKDIPVKVGQWIVQSEPVNPHHKGLGKIEVYDDHVFQAEFRALKGV